MTIQLLDVLRQRGVIELPWPAPQWELPPKGYLTPIEQLAWSYEWKDVELGGLEHHLEDLLQSRYFDDPEQSVCLWRDLVRAECIDYFEHQLGKHGFDLSWTTDIDWLPEYYFDQLSLVRWKYLIWSSVRHGATECLISKFSQKKTREAIAAMLGSSQRWNYTVNGNFEGLIPAHPTHYNLMGKAFSKSFSNLGLRFWCDPPNIDSLLANDDASL